MFAASRLQVHASYHKQRRNLLLSLQGSQEKEVNFKLAWFVFSSLIILSPNRCQARIKLDRDAKTALLLKLHNHNPETEIDPDGNLKIDELIQ